MTAFSEAYQEHYHSVSCGALQETLHKHVIPAMHYCQDRAHVRILDICFGLGYNTLATLWYLSQHHPEKTVTILSPEMDQGLISSLSSLDYPAEFEAFQPIIQDLTSKHYYIDEKYRIELYLGDARRLIAERKQEVDVVYQDPFSMKKNPELWSWEYFSALTSLLASDGLLTSYSTSSRFRIALHKLGFFIYAHQTDVVRAGTIASRAALQEEWATPIDMLQKIKNNPSLAPVMDGEIVLMREKMKIE